MFFVLSKLFFFVSLPLFYVGVLILYSLFTRRQRRSRRAMKYSILLLFIFSNPLITNIVCALWEYPATPFSALNGEAPYDVVIVLGGYTDSRLQPYDRLHTHEAGDRLSTALELYKTGKAKKILLTGGTTNPRNAQAHEAITVRRYLITTCVDSADIWIDPKSLNTRQNAMITNKILYDSLGTNPRCLLVTSAIHMRRAMRCFERFGVHVTPFATDIQSEPFSWSLNNIIMPDGLAVARWQWLLKEWIGMVAYKLRGYI